MTQFKMKLVQIGKAFSRFRKETAERTDDRIKMISEIFLTVALFNDIRKSMPGYFSTGVQIVAETIVSLNRIQVKHLNESTCVKFL